MNSIAIAIVIRNGKVLVQNRYRRNIGMVFEFPCGKVDEGESFEVAAMRELFEETGMTACKPVKSIKSISQDGRELGYVILHSTDDQQPTMVNPASKQTFYWFEPDEIPLEDFPPADQDFIRKELKKSIKAKSGCL